jgi:predicted RNA-binding Zn ribbon-like protein
MHTMNSTVAAEYQFDLDGGRLCLDFVNTRSSTTGEHLAGYADLVSFARQSHVITPAEGERLQTRAAESPSLTRQVVERALRVREALRVIFSAIAADEAVPLDELERFNDELGRSLRQARVEPTDTGFDWAWAKTDALESVLWPIARSAADLLVSDTERAKVRECGASDCRWLFLDTSKNRSRQWCSMASCGNREKARRHYQRVRARR